MNSDEGDAKIAGIVSLARCGACLRMARVEREICDRCRRLFGERMAVLTMRIRRDEAFRRLCVMQLGPDARVRFFETFGGDPRE
jgi:hypothetical protein